VGGWPDAEFDAFVAARMPALTRFAYSLTGDQGHAEDVVQTALIKTYLATRRRCLDAPEAYGDDLCTAPEARGQGAACAVIRVVAKSQQQRDAQSCGGSPPRGVNRRKGTR
jgi:hypothetical protein